MAWDRRQLPSDAEEQATADEASRMWYQRGFDYHDLHRLLTRVERGFVGQSALERRSVRL